MHKHYVTKRRSRLDHVFSMEHTIEAITRCEALPDEQGVSTNHFPIITELNLEVSITGRVGSKNFREVNWNEFCEKLTEKMSN